MRFHRNEIVRVESHFPAKDKNTKLNHGNAVPVPGPRQAPLFLYGFPYLCVPRFVVSPGTMWFQYNVTLFMLA